MFLGLGHGFGFNQQRAALSQLTELVRSLGGHIFAPGLETYADQAALNPAASALDSQVGYVGSAATQGLGENLLLNSSFTGASVGSPGSRGSGWSASSGANGLAISVTAASANSITLRVNGTATANGNVGIVSSSGDGSATVTFPGQLLSGQAKLSMSGTYVGSGLRFTVCELNSSHSWVANAKQISNPTSGAIAIVTGRVSNANAAFAYLSVDYFYTINEVVDFYVTVENPQLERGHPTAYTPTYGTAISRGVFASAAQGTLANTPKLLTLGNSRGLEFDGSTDYIGADVQTAASGYVCAVIRQTADFSTARAFLGSGSFYRTGFSLYTTSGGTVVFSTNEGGTQTSVLSAGAALAVGELAVVDASYTPTGKSIRKNGAFEGTSSTASNPATNNLLLIGGRNTGVVGAEVLNIPFTGSVGAFIYIPNVTLPAATEQRIRKLVGQIYGVATQ